MTTPEVPAGEPAATVPRVPSRPPDSVFVEVFLRHVVDRELARGDLTLIGIGRVLDAADHLGLVGLPFLEQLLDAFRAGDLVARQPHGVARLAAGLRAEPSPRRPGYGLEEPGVAGIGPSAFGLAGTLGRGRALLP